MSFLHKIINSRRAFLNIIPTTNQVRNYAARKGTRMKAMKKKKSSETGEKEKLSWTSRMEMRQRKSEPLKFSKLGSSVQDEPVDDVYFMKFYKYRSFSVANAIEMHKETHDETMYNQPNAFVYARLELDMSLYKKKNKCLDGFKSSVFYPNRIDYSDPFKVVAICQRPEDQAAAREAGAYLVADLDFIQQLQSGEVSSEFDYCVTTPDLISQLVPIRGILNKRFPSTQKGTADFDVRKMVSKLAYSVEYKVKTNNDDLSYALIETPVGRLTTPPEQIEDNLSALVADVCARKPLSLGPPIIRLLFLTSPPTKEKFKIDHQKYIPDDLDKDYEEDSDDEEMFATKKR